MVLLVEEVTCVTSCTSVTHSNIHAGFVIFSFILMVQNYKSNTICTMYNTEPQRMEPSSRTDRHVMDAFKTERTNKRDWVITDFSDNISDTVRLWRLSNRRMTRQVDSHTTARESYGENRVEIETYPAESWKITVIKNNNNLCMYVCMYINILVSDGNPPNIRYPYLKVKASQTMVWLVWFPHVSCELSISRWSD